MLELPDVPPWEDAAAWSVHADRWLSDGDPRGAELDAELAGMPSSDARASRLRGEPGWPAEDVALARLAEAHPAQLEVEWRHGFVLRAHVSDGPIAGQSLLQALLEAPAGRYLAELVVDTLWNDKVALGEPGRRGRVSWALTQLETSILPWLKTLQLGAASIEGDRFRGREFVLEQSNWTLGSPTEVFAPPDRLGPDLTTAVQHPSLRTLRIYGECLQLGPLNLPRLNELDVQGRFVPWPAVQAILASALPDLEKLRLWLGHRADDQAHKAGFTELYGPPGEPDLLQPLWAGCLPSLKHLAVTHHPHVLWRAAADSSILRRLRTLDLSDGLLADHDAVLALATPFAHLERLDLSRNELSAEHVARLSQLLPGLVARAHGARERDSVDGQGPQYTRSRGSD